MLSLGLIQPVVLLTDVLYLQQSTSSQAAKPAGSSPGQQPCCLRVFVVLSLMSWSLLLLLFLLLLMMFVFSLWSCSALCEDSAVISSVSIPRIFGSVCVCTVSLKSTLQNLLPKSLSLPLMCGKCCLLAPLSFSLSLSRSLSPSLPLLSCSSLSCSYSSPPDTKPCLIHLSSPVSSRPHHPRSHFIFSPHPLLFTLSLCSPLFSSPFLFYVLAFVLPPKLCLHTYASVEYSRTQSRSHTPTHTHNVSVYISLGVWRVKSPIVLVSPET